jgi:hypothetical protein
MINGALYRIHARNAIVGIFCDPKKIATWNNLSGFELPHYKMGKLYIDFEIIDDKLWPQPQQYMQHRTAKPIEYIEIAPTFISIDVKLEYLRNWTNKLDSSWFKENRGWVLSHDDRPWQ